MKNILMFCTILCSINLNIYTAKSSAGIGAGGVSAPPGAIYSAGNTTPNNNSTGAQAALNNWKNLDKNGKINLVTTNIAKNKQQIKDLQVKIQQLDASPNAASPQTKAKRAKLQAKLDKLNIALVDREKRLAMLNKPGTSTPASTPPPLR